VSIGRLLGVPFEETKPGMKVKIAWEEFPDGHRFFRLREKTPDRNWCSPMFRQDTPSEAQFRRELRQWLDDQPPAIAARTREPAAAR